MSKIGPNQPCECGSGKKFKKCCGAPKTTAPRKVIKRTAKRAASMLPLAAAFFGLGSMAGPGPGPPPPKPRKRSRGGRKR